MAWHAVILLHTFAYLGTGMTVGAITGAASWRPQRGDHGQRNSHASHLSAGMRKGIYMERKSAKQPILEIYFYCDTKQVSNCYVQFKADLMNIPNPGVELLDLDGEGESPTSLEGMPKPQRK